MQIMSMQRYHDKEKAKKIKTRQPKSYVRLMSFNIYKEA